LGALGEQAATRLLRRKGYVIVSRRHRDAGGEIDLIAVDQRTLVFVEVKTRRSSHREHPAEAVDREKQRRVARAAVTFMKQHQLLNHPARFDIVAVIWPADARRPTIEHFPAAFELPDDL
jgi:putative endonuclease